jgi:hypothetical protein
MKSHRSNQCAKGPSDPLLPPYAGTTLLALKSPAVTLAESLLTEAVLKHARVVPNRRP